jgi:uncharacterized membrane protein HdeD (DUF308 family)
MPEPRDFHRQASNVLSAILIVLGVVITIRTVFSGADGFALGFLLGPLFIAAGIGRIYINLNLQRRGDR